MGKLSKEDIKELVSMKDLTVKECIEKIKEHPRLQFLLTTAGIWIAMRFIFFIFITINVMFVVSRIFSLVLG